MKICVTSNHIYPARKYGFAAAHLVHDELVKGLAELNHEVIYVVDEVRAPMPKGVTPLGDLPPDAEVYHINDAFRRDLTGAKFPWVQSAHCDLTFMGYTRETAPPNYIHASETHARRFNSVRFAHNGFDPDDFIYKETKDDYLFFIVGGLNRADEKGLDIALSVARKAGIELRVAGSQGAPGEVKAFERRCRAAGATPVGHVLGEKKTRLFAGAKALLFPSRYIEGCPLVVLEALFSGTPVISCDLPSMPEIIDGTVGFLCHTETDYLDAIQNIGNIHPSVCRDFAIERYHYRCMTRSYLHEYMKEIEYFRA